MRYESDEDLPDIVRNQLPPAAQALFRSAYNQSWDAGEAPADPDAVPLGRDERAHEAGWAAVRAAFERDPDGRWQARDPDSRE